MQFPNSIWCTWCLLIVGCATLCRGALTQGEKDALSGLLGTFPNLASIPTSEVTIDQGIYYGQSWTNNFDSLCLNGHGYEYYGLFCENGHISGIVITRAWAKGLQTDFSFINGLTSLRNVTCTAAFQSTATENLILALMNLQLEHFWCMPSLVLGTGDFGQPFALKNFSGALSPSGNLTPFENLQYLHMTITNLHKPSNLGIWPTSLVWVRIDGYIDITGAEELVRNLTSIQVLNVRTQLDSEAQLARAADFSSNSLESLEFGIQNVQYYSTFSVIVNSTSLKAASFSMAYSLTLDTPNLRKLSMDDLDDFPTGFSQLIELEELSFLKFNNYGEFPDLGFAPNLTHLSFTQSVADPAALQLLLCNISNYNSKFTSLTLTDTSSSPTSGLTFELPYCLRDAPQFRKLKLTGFLGSPFNISLVLAALPRTMEDVTISIPISGDLNLDDLFEFSQLKNLHIYTNPPFVGEMQNNFFLNFPDLEDLSLLSNSLNGTIPSTGWTNKRSVVVSGSHSAWSGFEFAPFLKELFIQSSALESIPDDNYFSNNLPELETLHLSCGQGGGIPTPSFWTRLPKIQTVSVTMSNFSGPITSSLAAPRATEISFTMSTLCGPLPDIDVPMSLSSLTFADTKFSGSIPESWVSNLTIRTSIYLNSNMLSGTIPSNFLKTPSVGFEIVSLGDNYFSGPLWNLSQNYPSVQLDLHFNNFNVCESNTLPSEASIDSCVLGNLPVCPSEVPGCATYWANCSWFNCESSPVRVLPSIPECIARSRAQPISTNIPITPCPPPGPLGFQCVDGQWIYEGSANMPSITVPPNVGVITVTGNLSVTGSLTFDGLGTSIEVEGCVEMVPREVIIIIKDDEKLKTTHLLTQKGSNCSQDLSLIPVSLAQNKENCKQIKSSTKGSTRSSLVVAFDLDSHKCNISVIINEDRFPNQTRHPPLVGDRSYEDQIATYENNKTWRCYIVTSSTERVQQTWMIFCNTSIFLQ